MTLAIFIFVVFAAVGRFADFVLGARGGRSVRKRMADFYVSAGESNWFGVFSKSVSAYSQFLTHPLRHGKTWRRVFFVTLSFSLPLNLSVVYSILYDHVHSFTGASRLLFWSPLSVGYICTITFNFFLDVLALLCAINISRQRFNTPFHAFALLSVGIIITYCLIVASVLFSDATMATTAAVSAPNPSAHLSVWKVWISLASFLLMQVILHPWRTNALLGGLYSTYFGLAVAFPMTVLVSILMISLFVYLGRPVLQKPLMLILERLDERVGGVFTAISSAIGIVVGLLTSLQKLLG